MGKYVNGINGAFTGKVGNIIGSSWRGIPYMKSRSYRTKPATEGEKINRFIFGMTQQWLKPLKEFLRIGFNNYTITNQGVNAAKSFLYKNALIKDGFDSVIDPTLAKVSHGDLPLPARMDVELSSDNKLIFTWDPKSKRVNNLDQVMLLAYDIERGEAAMKILGQFRETGRDELNVVNLNSFVVYAAFVSADRNTQSDSVYLGSFTTFETEESEEKTDSESKAKVKNKSASSAETASSAISEEASETEAVPKNKLNLFEPLEELTDNQAEPLKVETPSNEKSATREEVSDHVSKEDFDTLKSQESINQAETAENINKGKRNPDTPAVGQPLPDEESENKSLLNESEKAENQAEPDENITGNEIHSDTQTSVNQNTADRNIRNHANHSDTQASVDLSLKDKNPQNNVTLSETKADAKREIPDKPPLTKRKNPDKQKFTYINPNIEIEDETTESPDSKKEEPDEQVIYKKGRVTYITSKKHLDKTRHKGRS